jgi:TAT (twin-arginine translocation) pathway signal sequence
MKKGKQDGSGFSRREFIKATATGAGAAAVTGLGVEAAKAEARPARWDK